MRLKDAVRAMSLDEKLFGFTAPGASTPAVQSKSAHAKLQARRKVERQNKKRGRNARRIQKPT
jgi:hypothetical protein